MGGISILESLMIKNAVAEYAQTNNMLPGQIFFRAYRQHVNKQMSLDEQRKVCKDLAGYQVHGYVPEYVRLLCGG